MAGSVEQITRDIAALDKLATATAEEFRSTYASYLSALGQAVRQQLVLSGFHLCTQGYPEKFLQLSLSQRQQLQQSLRQLGRKAQEQLSAQLETTIASTEQIASELKSPIDSEEVPALNDLTASEVSTAEQFQRESAELSPTDQPDQPLSTPETIAQWQPLLEEAIAYTLQSVSHEANRMLQQVEILPKQLPEAVLEVAAKSEEVTAEAMTGPPHLLNLLIETVGENPSDANAAPIPNGSSLTHVVAVCLRLAEIEFADPTVMAWRHKIRSLTLRVQSLVVEYRKKQRQHTIATAEAAWRSCWFED